jgi:hypothetical protein
MNTYQLSSSLTLDLSSCPPPILLAAFPSWNGEPCEVKDGVTYVTFASPQTPADNLGPLVRVELVPEAE